MTNENGSKINKYKEVNSCKKIMMLEWVKYVLPLILPKIVLTLKILSLKSISHQTLVKKINFPTNFSYTIL